MQYSQANDVYGLLLSMGMGMEVRMKLSEKKMAMGTESGYGNGMGCEWEGMRIKTLFSHTSKIHMTRVRNKSSPK